MRTKWKPFVLLFLLFLPLLQGCGTAEGGIAVRELNQLNVVMVTGVDYDPKHKKFILSIQSVKPSTEKGAAIAPESVYTTRATGDTIMEASKNLRAQTSGKLIWFHSKIIIFGETLVKQKVLPEVVDFFARNREIRYSSWILIAKGTAEDIVTAKPNSEVTMGYELVGIINNQAEWGRTVVVSLRDAINSYANPHESFITGQVKKVKGKDNKEQIIITDGVVIGTIDPENPLYRTTLDKKEVRALRLLHKVTKQEAEVIYSILLDGASGRKFNTAVQLNVEDRKVKSVIENGLPKIYIDLSLNGTVLETSSGIDFGKEETIAELERKVQSKIIADTHNLLTKMQKKEGADIFGFSSLIHREHKNYWHQHKQQWKEIYPNIPVHVSVRWSELRIGMINQLKVGER